MYINKDVQPINPPDEENVFLPDPQERMSHIYDRDRLIIIELFQDLIVDECDKIVDALFERDNVLLPPKLHLDNSPNHAYRLHKHINDENCKKEINKHIQRVWDAVQKSDFALELYENGGYE